ncbi:StAR lipid transfer protein 7 mitochondrial, partial [Fasciolopsis buskii]
TSVRSIHWLREFYRKASICVYEIWRSQTPSFRRFCIATQRTVLANLLLFRHSSPLVFRRVSERYWSLQNNLRKEFRILQAQRILLGGCILSFAQDKITDEELMSTIRNFTTNPDRVPDPPEKISHSLTRIPSQVNASANKVNLIATDSHQLSFKPAVSSDRFVNPPLTVVVRQLRKQILQLVSRKLTSINPSETQAGDSPDTPTKFASLDKSNMNHTVDTYFAAALPTLSFQPDGTGFVDDTWDLIVNRQDLRVWRRPVEPSAVVQTQAPTTPAGSAKFVLPNTTSPKSTLKYEYRLCGTMKDVSALSFLEVQLNLAYRRYWDERVISLDYLHPTVEDDNSPDIDANHVQGDLIRWVARFPFPMAQREYIYARRWWLETVSDVAASHSSAGRGDSKSVLSTAENCAPPMSNKYGKHALVLSRSCMISDNSPSLGSEHDQSESSVGGQSRWAHRWSHRLKPVLVTAYRSEMLIQAHGRFDDLGMNYYLNYYDDPHLPVGDSTLSLLSGKAMNQFISQLHSAALALHQCGLPSGVDPIVFHPRDTESSVTQSSPPSNSPDTSSPNSETPQFTTTAKTKLFPDYPLETKHTISNTVY